MKYFFLVAALFATAAMAADAPPAISPSYAVTLTVQEWQQVASAVRRSDTISARSADDLVIKIGSQIQAQSKLPKK